MTHTLFVSTGATVRWQNQDDTEQVISSDAGWFIGQMASRAEFVWQPDKFGIFTYHNENAPSNEGVIVTGR